MTAAVKAVGDRLEVWLGTHDEQREVWKAVRQMMASEDAWRYRDQPVCEDDMEACEKQKLLAMMGTSVEVQKALKAIGIVTIGDLMKCDTATQAQVQTAN